MATEESKRVSLDGSSSSVSMKAQDEESGVVILNRHLPSGIISDIISRLPLEDIIRCSSVSTDWYRITKNLRSNHLHNTKSQILDILLAESGYMSFDYVGVNNSLHMLSSNSRRSDGKCKHVEIANVNELTGRVIGSCNGLLCLAYQMGSPYAIYNPITKETMMLTELELHPQCDKPFAIRAGFGYDPINNKYKVVVAYDYRRYINKRSFTLVATGDIITLGESSWRRLQFPEEVKGRIDTYQPAVFINGAFHWLNGMQHDYEYSDKETYQLDGILTLDISTEKFKVAKFSAFVDLDVSRIEVFTIGSSLALLGQKLDDHSYRDDAKPPPTKIWKILGENADGGCLYQCMTLNVGVKTMQLLTEKSYLTPVGAVGNDKFLFKASHYGPNGKLNCLVLYDTEINEAYVLEVPAEVPKDWDATIFQPSLVHPPSSGKCTFT